LVKRLAASWSDKPISRLVPNVWVSSGWVFECHWLNGAPKQACQSDFALKRLVQLIGKIIARLFYVLAFLFLAEIFECLAKGWKIE